MTETRSRNRFELKALVPKIPNGSWDRVFRPATSLSPQVIEQQAPITEVVVKPQTSIQEVPSLQEDTRGVRLSMFLPENADAVDNSKLAEAYLGPKHTRDWLAMTTNADRPKFQEREERLQRRALQKDPSLSVETYTEKRQQQIESLNQQASTRINRTFSDAVQQNFKVEPENTEEFVYNQFNHAKRTIYTVRDTLFPHQNSLSVRNETGLTPESIPDVVKRVASDNTDSTLKFEERRRMLLAHTSAEFSAASEARQAEQRLARIQSLLNRELFEGLEGSTEYVVVRAAFDKETNTVLAIDDLDSNFSEVIQSEAVHTKSCEVSMRKIKGLDFHVYTNPNRKTVDSSVIKALRKAQIRGEKTGDDLINAHRDVQDTHRIKFAVMGGQKEVDLLVDRVFDIFVEPENQKLLHDLDVSDIVQDITEDSDTNGTAASSNDVKFRRLQVQFADLTHPVELMFQSMKGFLDGEYQVGEYNEAKGKYTGASHDLYQINRLQGVRPYIYPQEIYPRVDMTAESKKTMEKKVEELRG